jgi:uncharacterized membrane protein (UPF0127 family)
VTHARILSLVLLAVVVGCGGPEPAATESATPEPAPVESAPTAGAGTVAPDDPTGTGAPAPAGTTQSDGATPGAGSPLEPSEPFSRADIALVGPDGERIRVPVYVAATGEARSRGLMFREELPPGTGMIFLFPEPTNVGFFMKNTVMPLSIAWYGDDGVILVIRDMEPCPGDPCPTYSPGATYTGALEVPQGLFADLGVNEGWTVELPEDLPAPS